METTTTDTYEATVCTDCLMLIANGETPPEMDEDETAAYLASITAKSGGIEWVPSSWPGVEWTDEDRHYGYDTAPEFSSWPCAMCGDGRGGDRHPVTGWDRPGWNMGWS